MTENGFSPADLAAVTNSNDGFGGGNAWWIIILFLFVFCNGGIWGNNRQANDSTSVYEGYVLQNDFSQLASRVNAIGDGICDSTFALNNTINNGFYSSSLANMQQANAIQSQLSNCCCENRAATMDVKYTLAQDTCSINNTLNMNTRDIIDSQNANARAILDAIQQSKIDALQDRIIAQNQEISALNLAASQQAQNAYLISQLKTTTSGTTTA